ncbi:fumarate hydratase [Sphingobacterium sp. Mn56C]|uniref:fumarate hydratase n=1 Tax=Sphingobacterium sp. Mn56C TaxID=3395261 RepID=UPI003BE8300B
MKKLFKEYSNKKAYLGMSLGMLFALLGCYRHSDMQTEGVPFLQGIWVQDSVAHQDQLLSYTLNQMTFTCDSMYTQMQVHAKTQTLPDSCYKGGQWTEFAKAVYVLRGDSIIVDGVYTKENGKQKISGCYKSGEYAPRFKLTQISKDSIILENRFDGTPILLRKIKDITCVPKKRWET